MSTDDDEPDILGDAAKAAAAHPLLSDKEVAAALAEAQDRVRKEAVAAAKKKIVDDEVLRLKHEEGMHTGDGAKDELVPVYIDLAEHSDKLLVNMQPYWHGHTYTVPRHVANSLREQMARGWSHQDEIDGKIGVRAYARRRQTTLNGRTGATTNAPGPLG